MDVPPFTAHVHIQYYFFLSSINYHFVALSVTPTNVIFHYHLDTYPTTPYLSSLPLSLPTVLLLKYLKPATHLILRVVVPYSHLATVP